MPKKITPDALTKLTEDLKAAREAAEAAIAGMSDGGTCCFDHPVFVAGFGRSPKTNAAITAAIQAAGFYPTPGYGLSQGRTALGRAPGSNFQGRPRTVGAQAVVKVLCERGYHASVHYAVD